VRDHRHAEGPGLIGKARTIVVGPEWRRRQIRMEPSTAATAPAGRSEAVHTVEESTV